MRAFTLALLSTALAACAVEVPPSPAVHAPAGWTQRAPDAPASTADGAWWHDFADPAFQRVVERAGNVSSVRIAEARLDSAEAALARARADLLPQFTYGGSAGYGQQGDRATRNYNGRAALNLLWDVDLSGAGRARRLAALSDAKAAGADLEGARLSARAAAARLYIAWAEAEHQAVIAQGTVDSLSAALDLAKSREKAGLASGLDPAQADAALARAKALVPSYKGVARSSALALEALLGLNPGGLSDLLSSQMPIPLGAAAPTLSAPLTVVASRPDLKAAELRLAATGYTVTAAQRDRWPKLSLSGIVGAQTYAPESLFAGPGLVRSAAAEFTAPLFNFGRTRAAINAAKAQQAIAAETYAQAVVDALSEVERALNELGAAQGESETLAKAVAAAAQETALARSRYTAGLSPLLNVLTAEQGLLDAQSRLASAQARTGNALIALNTAMGRGV